MDLHSQTPTYEFSRDEVLRALKRFNTMNTHHREQFIRRSHYGQPNLVSLVYRYGEQIPHLKDALNFFLYTGLMATEYHVPLNHGTVSINEILEIIEHKAKMFRYFQDEEDPYMRDLVLESETSPFLVCLGFELLKDSGWDPNENDEAELAMVVLVCSEVLSQYVARHQSD